MPDEIGSEEAKRREESKLVADILASQSSSNVVQATLKTDERVIARVTDGIYRQPASAIRELISNAYDADATRVVVTTDAPRFSQIVVEDNGHGMSAQVVAHLLLHIGGSAKRNLEGQQLGVTSVEDSTLSPAGRKLIGKIGIGLFSVSQLTQTFQIITKISGEHFRTVATVVLKQFSDEPSSPNEDKKDRQFESGRVKIWREPAIDVESHGTSIVLSKLRPQAKNTLSSRELWIAIENAELHPDEESKHEIKPPKYHIGRLDSTDDELLRRVGTTFNHLPWSPGQSPADAFDSMVNTIWLEAATGNVNPQLETLFDYYLRMVWQLGLSIPLPYVEGHPFDLPLHASDNCYLISNVKGSGAAARLAPTNGSTLRKLLDLESPLEKLNSFEVFVDGLKLARPLRFTNLLTTKHALKAPIYFVGKCREDFAGVDADFSGGPIAFEAYLVWAPKIAPTEHQGSLIRIHGSSGTLFDPTFLRYGVSEQTRLRQITCEIFIHEGLDSALNIDRESFNNAHPHSVFIARWLHNALRQVATVQKRLGRDVRTEEKLQEQERASSDLRRLGLSVWKEAREDEGAYPPDVLFSDSAERNTKDDSDTIVLSRELVMQGATFPNTENGRLERATVESKLKVITQVLAAFNLLEDLSTRQQELLLQTIQQIITSKTA
jgi:hypothetical protein